MITIKNSKFDAQGGSNRDKVYGITLQGNEDVLIQNCVFANTGYSAILNHSTGNVIIEDCDFLCGTMYNPIEGSQQVDNGNVMVVNCRFSGIPGNNYVNFYQVADGSQHEILGCSFTPSVDNNIVRLSNRTSASAKFLIKDCNYDFSAGEPSAYTGFMLCQDYTNKDGVKQDFTKYAVKLDNVLCNGVKVADEGAVEGCIYYVYEDGNGIITGKNDPVVTIL